MPINKTFKLCLRITCVKMATICSLCNGDKDLSCGLCKRVSENNNVVTFGSLDVVITQESVDEIIQEGDGYMSIDSGEVYDDNVDKFSTSGNESACDQNLEAEYYEKMAKYNYGFMRYILQRKVVSKVY